MRPLLSGLALMAGLTTFAPSSLAVSSCELWGGVSVSMLDRTKQLLADGCRAFLITSHGGSLLDGIAIGHVIRKVPDATLTAHGHCFSSCAVALMVVPPERRYASKGSRVGFHGASNGGSFAVNEMWTNVIVTILKDGGAPPEDAERWGRAINVRPLTDEELGRAKITIRLSR